MTEEVAELIVEYGEPLNEAFAKAAEKKIGHLPNEVQAQIIMIVATALAVGFCKVAMPSVDAVAALRAIVDAVGPDVAASFASASEE